MRRKLVSCGPNLKARYMHEAMSSPVLLPVDVTSLFSLLQTLSSHALHIDPKHFTFRSKGYTSSILEAAYDRYATLVIAHFVLLHELPSKLRLSEAAQLLCAGTQT